MEPEEIIAIAIREAFKCGKEEGEAYQRMWSNMNEKIEKAKKGEPDYPRDLYDGFLSQLQGMQVKVDPAKPGTESEEVTFQVQSVPGNRIGSEPNEQIAALEKEVNELGRICEEKDAKITELRTARDSERWFQLLKATHRKLKRAQRAIKYHHRTSKLQYDILVSHNHNLSNAYQDIKSDYDSMRIRMEKAEKKVNDITDNIDKFIEDRRRLAEDEDVLLTLSQQTQINEKNKLIEQLKKENEELKAKLYEKKQTEKSE